MCITFLKTWRIIAQPETFCKRVIKHINLCFDYLFLLHTTVGVSNKCGLGVD